MKKSTLFLIYLFLSFSIIAQEHNVSKTYQYPQDPLVQQNLEEWRELKFGLFMHWGTYSSWGVVESWSICPEDEGWTQRRGPHASSYYDYVKAYENLQTQFNPINFQPEKWAEAAKEAGMKYVVFTTKHHDGFAMFDTQQSDYKITDEKTPFSKNPRANVTNEIFKAFRTDGFKIGAYFSKPDWHSPYYWWPYFPPKDRNVNYDPKKYPERWENFKQYTYKQIEELMTGYGKVDILWLDGGWVRPLATVDTTVEWQRGIKTDQDIDMSKIAAMARQKQPGIMVVDRTVAGAYENYVTPEQTIPNEPLNVPWESCMTLGNSFSYVPNDQYKSATQIIHNLIKIVSRGGNYLLNIAPGPNGDWDPNAYSRLKDIGKWITINGEAIYGSDIYAPYQENQVYYTQNTKEHSVYAFLLLDDQKPSISAKTIDMPLKADSKLKGVQLLGYKGKIHWKINKADQKLMIDLPNGYTNLAAAAVFKAVYQ